MIHLIPPNAPPSSFPDSNRARKYPDGLLAAGGDLSIERLVYAYQRGIFPWYSEGDPILWWTPDPRCVLFPDQFHISKSFKKFLKKHPYRISHNENFEAVIQLCATVARKQEGTWINQDMQQAYIELFHAGFAHSIEVWQSKDLVGGLYGIWLGRVFFGESMFSLQSNTSKLAFYYLSKMDNIALIDCQVTSEHMLRMGACEIPRIEFERLLAKFRSHG